MGTIKVDYLVTKPRKKGPDARYWQPPARDIKAGFLPKTRVVALELTDAEAATLCETWTAELKAWRKAGRKETTKCRYPYGSVGWILHDREIGYFHNDAFLDRKPKTREGYVTNGKLLMQFSRDLAGRPGYLMLSGITLKAARAWHKQLMASDTGKPQVARAKAAITFLRRILNYAIEESKLDTNPLTGQGFKNPKPRKQRPAYRQILNVVAASRRLGRPSIGLATMAQFDLMQRQGDIIGVWEDGSWKDGLTWAEVDLNRNGGIVELDQNKSDGDVGVRIPLADYPILHRLLSERHAEYGENPHPNMPVILSEETGKPYKKRNFAKWFRIVADHAGWPKDLFNMDSRAGAVTEAVDGGAERLAIRAHSGHETDAMPSRYNRGSERQAANVAKIRRAVREQKLDE